jgi:filamentous hemagglutinin family protein
MNNTKNISEKMRRRRACALVLAIVSLCSPPLGAAAPPTIPGFYGTVPAFSAVTSLPDRKVGGTLVGATVGAAVGNTMTINQNQSQATIDWSSFNIAPGNVVIFSQKSNGVAQPQWAALNRIYDTNPSQIFGKIQADGKIYLINRNGILFGPGSQVNTHSLVVSNINITDANFTAGKLKFSAEPYGPGQGTLSSQAFVSNYGTITTDSGGSVFLVGPNVVNAGTISAPSGKINLIGAGQKSDGTGGVETVELTVDANGNDVTYSELQQVPGAAYNSFTGRLVTENGGRVGMYGATVQNDGLIRSVTAFKKGGVVILAARDKVTTGVGSRIESPIATAIDPATGKAETADPLFVFNHPEVIVKGLASESSAINPLSAIEHQGSIVAPSGDVTFTARNSIFLGDSSSIDVSGLWLDRSVSANTLEVQLNSVDLRDDFMQKYGPALGQKITVDLLTGSSIGNQKNNYLTIQTGAEERSTSGGSISFSERTDEVALGQLIIKQGALLDFSGGGIHYDGGTMATSRLVSGNRLYDIGSAPQWLDYDRVADSQKRTHQRFGITETFSGLYFGSGSSVRDLTAGRTVGSDAGNVLFNARVAALDGTLLGSVIRGQYQTAVTARYAQATTATGTPDNPDYLVSVVRGLEEPRGGTVTVGNALPAAPAAQNRDNEKDFIVTALTLVPTKTPSTVNINAATVLDQTKPTEIAADLLNSAGLSELNLFANTTITTTADAGINLLPGGSYVARARRIDFSGSIDIANGSVEMSTRPNASSYETLTTKPADYVNTLYQSVVEKIYLASESRISTAGRQIDNSTAGTFTTAATPVSHTAGGTILIQERTEGQGTSTTVGTSAEGHSLVVATGALLDVSGGWAIDAKGAISGGNAGLLDLKGPTLSLAGELRGHSLPGKNGGEIRLHAGEVQVAQRDGVLPANMKLDDPIPDYLLGRLVLGEHRLADTGFSRIALTSINDLSFSDGAVLTPSLVKLPLPTPAVVSQSVRTGNLVVPAGSDPAGAEFIGSTGVTLTAGRNIYENSPLGTGGDSTNSTSARIDLPTGTGISVAPGGSVALAASYIDTAGQIEAYGGSVTARADYTLTVKTGGQILAGGYSKPVSTTVAGLPAGSAPQAGGKITLESKGDVILESGSRLDVSGSVPTERLVADAYGTPEKVTVAGDPGSLSLSYSGALTLDGDISGAPRMGGLRGGALSVTNSTDDLKIVGADINRYQQSGFDALTFTSTIGSLVFPDKLDVTVGRSLTLDAAALKGQPGGDVTLRSPWITVTNTPNSSKDPASGASAAGTGTLALEAGGFLDVAGSVGISGFSAVKLQADRDLRFSDLLYTKTTEFAGSLRTGGDLTLQASRVYPTSGTEFGITTPGTVTILPGAVNGNQVYSAGGILAIAAAGGIDQRGVLLAPLGNISLDGGATGKVLLAEGSSTSTAGSGAVQYGSYDGSTWTTRSDINNRGTDISSAPTNSVTLKGGEVVVAADAAVNVSGGGEIFAVNFQSGIPGTRNPLTIAGRYVVLPDNSVTVPGNAVYLDAMPSLGLKAGIYSLLPADQYGFIPGALVVQDTGISLAAGQRVRSTQGYEVVAGYGTVLDTAISSASYKGYSVRSAADVLKEGDLSDRRSFVAGNGGDFTLIAPTATLNGTLSAQPLQGFTGGTLTLSAKNVIARNDAAPSATPTPETLVVNTLSVTGFGEVVLGSREYDSAKNVYSYSAETVTVESGSTLNATAVTLQAKNTVTVERGAVVEASGTATGGVVSVNVPGGAFDLKESGQVRAVNGLTFNVGSLTLLGQIGGIAADGTIKTADRGSFSLTANTLTFASTGAAAAQATVNGVAWAKLAGYDNLTLASRSDMNFLQNVAMTAQGVLTLDAGRYTTSADVAASFSAAGKLTLLNTGEAATLQSGATTGTLTFTSTGGGIDVSPNGNGIVFDRFRTVNLNSSGDLTLRGAGTVTAAHNITATAARVTTSYYKHDADPADKTDATIPYTAAAITLDARNGAVTIAGNGVTAGTTSAPGGSLEILGAAITIGDTETDATKRHVTTLDAPSAQVKLTATGNISLLDKSSILAGGSKSPAPGQSGVFEYTPGGKIVMESSGGSVNLAAGSTLDVSASDQGDAGAIVLAAATQGVTVSGTVKGSAANGQGGSLALDSATLVGVKGLDGLSTLLAGGGFTDQISVHSRSGDLTLTNGKTIAGREIVIAADGGSINLNGTISAAGKPGEAGGRVELYAGTALTLQSKAVVSATGGAGADGGTVALSSVAGDKVAGNYAMLAAAGSKIDVSAGSGGTGGTVSFRAYELAGADVNMAALPVGAITGASRVTVEEAKRYVVDGNIGAFGAPYNAFMSDAAMSALKTKLFVNVAAGDKAKYHLQAGVELASAAGKDLILDTAWDLSTVRPGGEAGVVTLRAGNNLVINGNLGDAPTAMATLYSSTMQNSWGINLIAGAAGGANYRASEAGTVLAPKAGDLTIAQNAIVYSENAPVTFTAANNANFAGWSETTAPGYMINNLMQYNLGSYGGTVRGVVGNDINLVKNGSAIQTALGDIDVRVGGNLNLGTQPKSGAIRTTGEYDNSRKVETMPGSGVTVAAGLSSYWTYHDGGSITLNVDGAVAGNLDAANGWDGAYVDPSVSNIDKAKYPWYLAAGFGGKESGVNNSIPVTVGIATMGGGDISVRSGGSLLTQIGAFGSLNSGNLAVVSGGDMTGRYRVMNGTASMISGGGFGADSSSNPTWRSVIEMGAAQVAVAARGDVHLGAVLNPENSRDRLFFGSINPKFWNMTYSTASGARISSLAGNVTLYGTDGFNAYNFSGSSTLLSSLLDRQKILPATFTLAAAGNLNVGNEFTLAPSRNGNLSLHAVGSISGSGALSGFKMVDVDVDSYYGRQSDTGSQKSGELRADPGNSDSARSIVVNHRGDPDPVIVTAGTDIDTLKLVLNKKAEITAGGDITKLDFIGQNTGIADVTMVSAGGNIDQGILATNLAEIMVGGPGTLLVEAKENINLGNSRGIESIGNSFNSGFTGDATDSAVIISAGARRRMLPTAAAAEATTFVQDYFSLLRQAGDDYSTLKAAGKGDEAFLVIENARAEIAKYFVAPPEKGIDSIGSITMTDSLIRAKKGDIYLMARGDVNVGRSNVSDSAQGKKDTGITTTFGGDLNIYSGRDLNVNESRTMTFMGGDIVIWSDQGDINAGRGSKTALSSGGSAEEIKDANGVLIDLLYPAPSVGSGVRASTYDPDGSTGRRVAPAPGDIYLFAPSGIIDAGEAGIAGGKIFLITPVVLHGDNINSPQTTGLPPSADSSVSLGALGGNSNMTDSSKMIETATTGGTSKESAKQKLAQAADDFLSKYLDVKVVGFDAEPTSSDTDTKEELEKKKKK